MKYKLSVLLALVTGAILTACASEPSLSHLPLSLPQLSEVQPGEEIAVIHTNHGEVWVRLFPDYAPLTVENFVTHARNGYYDGLIFHRVIENFMIQGGDPTGTGGGGESIWGGRFEDEFTPSLRHITGALAMANSGPNTNGSQFYIVNRPNVQPDELSFLHEILENQDQLVAGPDGSQVALSSIFPVALAEAYIERGGTMHLDFGHSVFGQVFQGMDVVNAISTVETGPGDRPVDDVIINTIEIRAY